MANFILEPGFDLARRIEIRGPHTWFVILKPIEGAEMALESFSMDLSVLLDRAPRVVSGIPFSIKQMHADLSQADDDPVVITDMEMADAGHWRALDLNRSALFRSGPVIFWLSSVGLASFCEYAPNLRSFVGGSIFNIGHKGEPLTAVERNQRISDLESHFKLGSKEVIEKAESGILPVEPHFVEWLVLLGRGDLV